MFLLEFVDQMTKKRKAAKSKVWMTIYKNFANCNYGFVLNIILV